MTTTETKPEAKVKKRVVKLSEGDFTLTESAQVMQTATPPVGTTREDVLNPIFWSHTAKWLRPMNEIRVMPKDGAWYGIFLVTYADNLQARVEELFFKQIESPDDPETDQFIAKWIAPPVRFGVVRKSDNEIIKSGFPAKADAEAWMRQNMK